MMMNRSMSVLQSNILTFDKWYTKEEISTSTAKGAEVLRGTTGCQFMAASPKAACEEKPSLGTSIFGSLFGSLKDPRVLNFFEDKKEADKTTKDMEESELPSIEAVTIDGETTVAASNALLFIEEKPSASEQVTKNCTVSGMGLTEKMANETGAARDEARSPTSESVHEPKSIETNPKATSPRASPLRMQRRGSFKRVSSLGFKLTRSLSSMKHSAHHQSNDENDETLSSTTSDNLLMQTEAINDGDEGKVDSAVASVKTEEKPGLTTVSETETSPEMEKAGLTTVSEMADAILVSEVEPSPEMLLQTVVEEDTPSAANRLDEETSCKKENESDSKMELHSASPTEIVCDEDEKRQTIQSTTSTTKDSIQQVLSSEVLSGDEATTTKQIETSTSIEGGRLESKGGPSPSPSPLQRKPSIPASIRRMTSKSPTLRPASTHDSAKKLRRERSKRETSSTKKQPIVITSNPAVAAETSAKIIPSNTSPPCKPPRPQDSKARALIQPQKWEETPNIAQRSSFQQLAATNSNVSLASANSAFKMVSSGKDKMVTQTPSHSSSFSSVELNTESSGETTPLPDNTGVGYHKRIIVKKRR